MITSASRFFLGLAAFALLAGAGHAFGSDFELYGIVAFLTLLGVAVVLGAMVVGQRDGTVAAPADGQEGAPVADLAPGPAPTQPSPWPLLGAIGLGVMALGVPAGVGYLALGAGIAGIAALESAVLGWSERLSADPVHNVAERDRVMLPLELPVGVALVGAFIALSLSRVLLAVSATGAVVVAGVVATVVLAVGSFVALRPNIPRMALQGLALVAALAVLAAGVGGLAAGEREFHHGDEAHAEDGDVAHPEDDGGVTQQGGATGPEAAPPGVGD